MSKTTMLISRKPASVNCYPLLSCLLHNVLADILTKMSLFTSYFASGEFTTDQMALMLVGRKLDSYPSMSSQ